MRVPLNAFHGRRSALIGFIVALSAVALPASATAAIAWNDCGERLQCARVPVPLDWGHPHEATIRLAVIRHLASRPAKRIGSMYVNPGGPGESGVSLVRSAGAGLDAMGRGRFDVVSWDPRGTNASAPVRCFHSQRELRRFWTGESIPITERESQRFRRKATSLARRCGEVSRRLLRHISTADTARDLDYLRSMVGERRLTYMGFSYGSFLGQTYANMFPGHVRGMVLDGIVDPVSWTAGAEARVANAVSPTDAVFREFEVRCQHAGPRRCPLARRQQSAAERTRRLFARVRAAPIPAPGADPPGHLTYADLLLSLFAPLRDPAQWQRMAADLDAALHGDGSALETRARAARSPAAWSGATTSAAIQCADGPARQSSRAWPSVIGRLTRISFLQGPLHGWWEWAPCASWPVRAADRYAGPWGASTKNPILLIGTRHDPSTAYRNARRAARRLDNAVLLTHAGYGHISFTDPSACIERARSAYLVHLVIPPRGQVCHSDRQPFDRRAAAR